MDRVSSKRLLALLTDFGLPAGTTVQELQRTYRRLAKECHPDTRPMQRGQDADFVHLHSRFQEALALMHEEEARKPRLSEHSADSVHPERSHYIISHGGLFYCDPYKWKPTRIKFKKEKMPIQSEPPGVATKVMTFGVLGCIMGTVLYIFDRTATGRGLL